MKISKTIVRLIVLLCIFSYSTLSGQDSIISWSLKANGAIYSYPVVNDTFLYFGSMNSTFYAVHTQTGKVLWTYKTPYLINSQALVYDGKVFIESGHKLYALDALTGDLKWEYVASSAAPAIQIYDTDYHHSSPFQKNGIIYFADGWANVNGVNAETGNLVFQYNTGAGSAIRSTPVIKDTVMYFGDWDSRIYAVSMKDCTLIWKDTLDGIRQYYGAIVSQFVIHDTLLYFGSQHDIYSPRDLKTGKPVWVFDDKKQTYLPSVPVFYGDSVIIGTTINSNRIYSVHNGNMNWEFPMDGICFVKPVIQDTVLFMNTSNFGGAAHLYFIDVRNGHKINEMSILSASPTSPVISGDLLFMGDNEGNMKAYRYKKFLVGDTLSISMDTKTDTLVFKITDKNYVGRIPVTNIGYGCDFIQAVVEKTGDPTAAGLVNSPVTNSHLVSFGKFEITYVVKPSLLEVGDYSISFAVSSKRHPDKIFNKKVMITIEKASDIKMFDVENNCKVFPVPAKDFICFTLKNQLPGEIEIKFFSTEGKELFSKYFYCPGNEVTTKLQISQLPVSSDGIVFYQVNSSSGTYSGKVLVINR